MRLLPRTLVPGLALCLGLPHVHAQDTSKPPLDLGGPAVEDLKLPWVAPPKEDGSLPDPTALAPEDEDPLWASSEASHKLEQLGHPGGMAPDHDRLHLDRPGDGNLWVRGRTYKARFGVDGATYVPFLGADAPRNFPVSFRLASAHAGAQSLALTDVARGVVERGPAVELDRGPVQVRYLLGLESIEQTFVLRERPAAGDLVLAIDVETELQALETEEGFTFQGEHGAVRYGRAVAVDDHGARLELASELVDGQIRIRVPAAFVAAANLPLTVDPVVSTFTVNNTSQHSYYPDIAYDATTNTYTACWEVEYSASDHDVYAQVLSSTGSLLSGAYVDYTTDTWRRPNIANNNLADQFLVIATEGPDGSRDIVGRTVEANSTTMGSQFQISGGFSGDKSYPDVGGDPVLVGPTYYCVVWRRTYSSTDSDIHYQLVRTDSTKYFGSTQYIDNSGGTIDFYPSVSKSNGLAPFGTQRWNVSFSRVYSSTDYDVRGAQLTWNGDVVTPSFSVDYSGLNHTRSDASSPLQAHAGERDYLVVYEEGVGTSAADIKGTLLSGDTEIQDYNLTDELELSGSEGQEQGGPTVSCDGTQFVVLYHELWGSSTSDWDIYAMTLRHEDDALALVEGHQNMAFSGTGEVWPDLIATWEGGGEPGRVGAIWYERTTAGDYTIEAALYDIDDAYANVGTSFCSTQANSTGQPADFRVLGSDDVSDDHLVFDVDDLPANEFGYFVMGQYTTSLPVFSGTLCINTPSVRLNQSFENSSWHGSIVKTQSLVGLPQATVVLPGQTWNFQYWYRDGSSSNFSNAVEIDFQ